MSILANYLAQLIKAQLNGEKPVSVPEEIQVEDLIHLSCKNHMEYLVMGALLKTDGISEEIQGILRSHCSNYDTNNGFERDHKTFRREEDCKSTDEGCTDEIYISVSRDEGNVGYRHFDSP